MIKTTMAALRKVLLASAGGLGGFIFGCIFSLILLHAKITFEIHALPLGAAALSSLILCIVSGMLRPRFFMWYFLCPLSWVLSSGDSGSGHCGPDDNWPDFIYNVSYIVGLPAFGFGVVFSLPWLAGAGLLGITVFTISAIRSTKYNANKTLVATGDNVPS
jgi:hypothetical protein